MIEQKIIDYLKQEYNPEVILLGGSRAKGRETDNSDWDLFLLGPKKGNGGFMEFEGERLDVTFKSWPEENKPLTIPSGPLWPLKVLLNNSGVKLEKMLAKTKEDFEKGPLDLYRVSSLERFEKLESWKLKIEKYSGDPMVEFLYAGLLYEFAIRAWFELQNKWSLSPAEAMPIIQKEDKEFFNLLNTFVTSNSSGRPSITAELLNKLRPLYLKAKI